MGEHYSGVSPGRRYEPGASSNRAIWLSRKVHATIAGTSRRATETVPLPPDIAFLADRRFPPHLLLLAAKTARAKGLPASEILIHRGLLAREEYERLLAGQVGALYSAEGPNPKWLDPVPVASTDELRLHGAIERRPGRSRLFISPQAGGYERIIAMAMRAPATFSNAVFTSRAALRRSVFQRSRHILARRAEAQLRSEMPEYSAHRRLSRGQIAATAAIAFCLCAGALVDWRAMLTLLATLISTFYLAIIVLRGILIARLDEVTQNNASTFRPPPTALEDYPVYSILVALHQEADQVADLVHAIDRLDWPRTKREIFLICEEDDPDTIAAIRARKLPEGFELLICPPGRPRTKPKALDFALVLCSGEYTVIYDAEDRPDPLQLREAWAALKSKSGRLACVQAPLLIHNEDQNWLTRLFSLEYLTLFRGMLPVLAGLRAPLPLGGTSNHFRTDVLRAVGGWDPYNVTEDADLGIRMARFGWRCGTITHPTWEEAPPKFGVWLRQRTRWQKGWLQTILVHSRRPLKTARELGLASALFFHLTITAIVISALIHPYFLALLGWEILGLVAGRSVAASDPFVLGISVFNLVGGYTTYGFLAYGVQTLTGNRNAALWLLTLPAYWLLISLAGWRALAQFVTDPFRWEKTPHGLANPRRKDNI